MKKKLKESKTTIQQAQIRYGSRSESAELTRAFYEFLQTYVPRDTPSRIEQMHLYFIRGIAQAGEAQSELLYELAEDMIAVKTLFDTLDRALIPLPTQYVDENESSKMSEP